MENNPYSMPFDAVKLTIAVLKRLGSYDLSTLDNRIRCQKIQYFAQNFKVSPNYRFSLYIRGPYSPALTRDLFAATSEKLNASTERFASDELESRFEKLKQFITSKSTRELELIATLHWLLYEAKLSRSEAMLRLNSLKKPTAVEIMNTEATLKGMLI